MDAIIVNITWNPHHWRGLYVNPKAGHSYVKKYPGHESLNFYFGKRGIDTKEKIYGYSETKAKRLFQEFKEGGVVVFYTNNTDKNKGEIVGIYCNAKLLNPPKEVKYKGFQNDILYLNIEADRRISMLFPVFLDSKKYFDGRLVPQVGYRDVRDISTDFVRKIIEDEINETIKIGQLFSETQKLCEIYKFVTGKEYEFPINIDEFEQNELEKIEKSKSKNEIVEELLNVKPTDPVEVEIKGKTYKRDNKTIAQLKILRNYECQICQTKIPIKNGFYVEAAHIVSKANKGPEIPRNILILCPNHHKEFDYSDKKILRHTDDLIEFEMNGKKYNISLKVK